MQPTLTGVRLRSYNKWQGCMHSRESKIGRIEVRRWLAVLACLVLLYFAGGGSLLHHHTGDSDTPCHICQALHMPALAVAPAKIIPAAQQVAWHESLTQHPAPKDCFALHSPSRAPPTA